MLRLVAQSCPTVCNPMDCSLPDSSVHGDSPGKNTGVGCHALLQRIFPTQGSIPGLPHCRWILYCLSHQGSPPGKQVPWPPSITQLPLALATAEGWSCFCVYVSPPGPLTPTLWLTGVLGGLSDDRSLVPSSPGVSTLHVPFLRKLTLFAELWRRRFCDTEGETWN